MFRRFINIAIVLCVCLIVLPQITVLAQSINRQGVRFNAPQNFRELTLSNISRFRDELHLMDYTPEGFAILYLRDSTMIYYGVSEDWSRQINLRIYESELSQVIENFYALTEEQQLHTKQVFLSDIAADGGRTPVDSELITRNNVTFIRLNVKVHTEHAQFMYAQLFTIANGQNISLVYYNSSPDFLQDEIVEIGNVFNSVSVSVRANVGGGVNVLYFIFGAIGLLLLLLVLIWTIRTFVKDFLYAKTERKVEHIKHRKR